MRLYRFSPNEFANDLTETGGLFSAGRWHQKGTRILYTSDCISLAKLELSANSTTLPENLSLITVAIPDQASVSFVKLSDLPENWQRTPYQPALALLAEAWLSSMTFWLLRVPSVHSPVEFNYLLNPRHPEHATLKLISIEPHPFDPRLK